MHFKDINDYKHEWDVDDLPWDAVNSIPKGEDHPDTLDMRVIEAIKARALPPESEMPPKTHAAAVAFLYIYMMMSVGGHR